MTKKQEILREADLLEALNLRQLQYFAIAAQECNLRRAAEILCISQPPLSRQITQLEEQLGVTLFVRHTKGLTLTEDGVRVLTLISSLLHAEKQTRQGLHSLVRSKASSVIVGFTTAFEQGLFIQMEHILRQHYGDRLRLLRASSPQLLRDLRRGKLSLAFVALPIASPGVRMLPLPYEEALLAVLPSEWPESRQSQEAILPLHRHTGKPLFWFRREANPDFFDFARGIFAHADFKPLYIEEPAEHDVLLARIAAGEGMGLLPASFAVIRREGVVFTHIREGSLLRAKLGCAFAPHAHKTCPELEDMVQQFVKTLPVHCNT